MKTTLLVAYRVDKDQTGGMNVSLKSSCFQPQNQNSSNENSLILFSTSRMKGLSYQQIKVCVTCSYYYYYDYYNWFLCIIFSFFLNRKSHAFPMKMVQDFITKLACIYLPAVAIIAIYNCYFTYIVFEFNQISSSSLLSVLIEG